MWKRLLLIRGAELLMFAVLAAVPLAVRNPYALGLLTLLAIYGILLIGLDVTVGYLGQVHPRIAAGLDLAGEVFLFELDVRDLLEQLPGRVTHQPLSRFPSVIQDLALVVDASVPAGKLEAIIASSALVAEVHLFDVYEGQSLAAGKRSLAFQVQFHHQL